LRSPPWPALGEEGRRPEDVTELGGESGNSIVLDSRPRRTRGPRAGEEEAADVRRDRGGAPGVNADERPRPAAPSTPASSSPAAASPVPAAKSIEEMSARHLKMLRAIQRKALDALRNGQFADAGEAAKALAVAVREERRIRSVALRRCFRRTGLRHF